MRRATGKGRGEWRPRCRLHDGPCACVAPFSVAPISVAPISVLRGEMCCAASGARVPCACALPPCSRWCPEGRTPSPSGARADAAQVTVIIFSSVIWLIERPNSSLVTDDLLDATGMREMQASREERAEEDGSHVERRTGRNSLETATVWNGLLVQRRCRDACRGAGCPRGGAVALGTRRGGPDALSACSQAVCFGTIPSCMWWSLTTMTTVGYGDCFPITLPGKAAAVFAMVLGIVVLALPITVLGSNFQRMVEMYDEDAGQFAMQVRVDASPLGLRMASSALLLWPPPRHPTAALAVVSYTVPNACSRLPHGPKCLPAQDVSGDGVIDELELRDFLLRTKKQGQLKQGADTSVLKLMDTYDIDGDGFLTLQQFKRLQQASLS